MGLPAAGAWTPDSRVTTRLSGKERLMLAARLRSTGMRSWHLQSASFASVGLCIGLWIRAKTVDQEERGNAERRALFVGLWPPMFWLIGDTIERYEQRRVWPRRRRR
jgi:hypothetical protein